MRVQIWQSPELDLWRWSLYTRRYAPNETKYHQETGSQKEVRDAMEDVATTIEYLIKLKEGG